MSFSLHPGMLWHELQGRNRKIFSQTGDGCLNEEDPLPATEMSLFIEGGAKIVKSVWETVKGNTLAATWAQEGTINGNDWKIQTFISVSTTKIAL